MREAYFRVISPVAEQRIKDNCCPNCGKPKAEWKRRTDWRCCSKVCTDNYYKEFDKSFSWQQYRLEVFKKDNSTCVMCKKQFTRIGYTGVVMPDESALIADHVVPIELGGSMWDLSNLQTLCVACNKIKTKSDMGNIARHRRRLKQWHRRTDSSEGNLVSPFVNQETLL